MSLTVGYLESEAAAMVNTMKEDLDKKRKIAYEERISSYLEKIEKTNSECKRTLLLNFTKAEEDFSSILIQRLILLGFEIFEPNPIIKKFFYSFPIIYFVKW